MKKIAYLIDDDDIYAFLVKKTLGRMMPDLEVEVYTDGLQAITHLKAIKGKLDQLPDMIMLDLNMPVMDGWEFLDEYDPMRTSLGKENLLYVVSSSVTPHEIERSKNIGSVIEFITKPISREKFTELLERL